MMPTGVYVRTALHRAILRRAQALGAGARKGRPLSAEHRRKAIQNLQRGNGKALAWLKTKVGREHLRRIQVLGGRASGLKVIRLLRQKTINGIPTGPESRFMKWLDAKDIPYEFQKRISKGGQRGHPYTADFFIKEALLDGQRVENLDVEIDHPHWHDDPKRQARDRKRDAYLCSLGYRVIRLSAVSGKIKELAI